MLVKELPVTLALLVLAPGLVDAFYLPGITPTNYKKGDAVQLNVNHLTPAEGNTDHTTKSIFSFDYYHRPFQFCAPENGPKDQSESLGSILFGDRIFSSPFKLQMGVNQTQCMAVCDTRTFEARDAKFVNRRIWQSYNINWLIDGLPAGSPFIDKQTDTRFYQPGFPLGTVADEQPMLNNHYDIFIDYHEVRQDQYRIVGVQVMPLSLGTSTRVHTEGPDMTAECDESGPPKILSETADTEVTWTYRVYWQASSTPFATRWDKYLHVFAPRIHWFSLVNSAVIVTFLIGMVSAVLSRTLKKDIARYNRLEQYNLDDLSGEGGAEEGVQEDSGWKLVHGDVFRPPKHSLLLAVFVGNGAQLFSMVGTTIAIAAVGFLSPSNRGALGSIMILLYTVFGFVGGYVSSRVYKSFRGEKWRQLFVFTPVLVPGTVFATFFLLNLFVWARQSSGAVPFTTMLVIVSIWFVISVPLSIAGSWAGYKQVQAEPPVKTNQIPRQIPPAAGYLRPVPSMLLVGVLPFGAIFVELYFIMSSLWSSRIYYMFGFLFLCFGLMVVTSAAVTILMIYFVLSVENYHWQWRAFASSGASAGYVFAYSLLYWVRSISFSSWTGGLLFLSYSALISFLWFVLTGSIGFVASSIFVHRIYGSLKID